MSKFAFDIPSNPILSHPIPNADSLTLTTLTTTIVNVCKSIWLAKLDKSDCLCLLAFWRQASSLFILYCRSQTHSLEASGKQCRVFCVRGQARCETHLVEITPENENEPLSACLRSRGCFVFYHRPAENIYLWHGSKATLSLKKCAHAAAKLLRNRWVRRLLSRMCVY